MLRSNWANETSKQERKESMQQRRNPATVGQMVAQIQDLQNTVNYSLSDAREFHDPESGSSSGATHVPDQTSTMSCRTLPRCDSGLPRNMGKRSGPTGLLKKEQSPYNIQQFKEFGDVIFQRQQGET